MSKLRFHNFLVSLDGYATGADQSTTAAFGDAQSDSSLVRRMGI